MENNVKEDIASFCANHPTFNASFEKDVVCIKGLYHFSCTYKTEFFEDFFFLSINVLIDKNKYVSSPRVYEDRRINGHFHHIYSDDKALCLATPTELKLAFLKNPSIEFVLEHFINPYLLGFLYFQTHKEMPFGERSHGKKGIIEYYEELFNLEKSQQVKPFLEYIRSNRVFRGHADCPCGSGIIIRKCHLNLMQWVYSPENTALRERIKEDWEVIK